MADLETIESELADVNSGERIAQFEKVQDSLTGTDGPQEEEQDACQMDNWESDVFEMNLQDQSRVQIWIIVVKANCSLFVNLVEVMPRQKVMMSRVLLAVVK